MLVCTEEMCLIMELNNTPNHRYTTDNESDVYKKLWSELWLYFETISQQTFHLTITLLGCNHNQFPSWLRSNNVFMWWKVCWDIILKLCLSLVQLHLSLLSSNTFKRKCLLLVLEIHKCHKVFLICKWVGIFVAAQHWGYSQTFFANINFYVHLLKNEW